MSLNKQGPGKIDWCDYTWNPVTGCKHGCSYCYLKRIRGFDMTPKFHGDRLIDPSKLKKPSKIFTVSAGDLFGSWVKKNWIASVILTAYENPQHIFMFLTKNPRRYEEFTFPKNCWLGTTIDYNEKFEERAEALSKKAESNLIFISFEPMFDYMPFGVLKWPLKIKWFIIGGKSGRNPFKPDIKWIDEAVKYAREFEIPLFIKDNAGYPVRIKEFPEEAKVIEGTFQTRRLQGSRNSWTV